MRRLCVWLLVVGGCGGDAGGTVKDWTAVDLKPGWGTFVDPDGDCKQAWKEGTLTFEVPGTNHELQGDGKKNAPRLVVEKTGDFAMSVKAAGKLAPTRAGGGGMFAPYHGAGILVWEGNTLFVRMERAKIATPNGATTYVNFEAQTPGGGRPVSQTQLPNDEAVHLRVERRGNKLVGLMSRDGSNWQKLGETALGTPGAVKVGVAAVNNSDAPFSPAFSDFQFFEAAKPVAR